MTTNKVGSLAVSTKEEAGVGGQDDPCCTYLAGALFSSSLFKVFPFFTGMCVYVVVFLCLSVLREACNARKSHRHH